MKQADIDFFRTNLVSIMTLLDPPLDDHTKHRTAMAGRLVCECLDHLRAVEQPTKANPIPERE